MKNKLIRIGLFLSILFFGSCREIKVKTSVNKNGSFTRMIIISGDSSEVFKSDLPYPIDESWESKFVKDTTDNEKYILTYVKSFKNSDLLNQEISQDTGWRKNLERNITVGKKFGFFYSYPTYTETIKALNPFASPNYKDYLSKEDLLWLSGKKLTLNSSDSTKSKQAEDKAEAYLQKAFTNEVILDLKQGIKELGNPEIPANIVDNFKDSIASIINKGDLKTNYQFIDSLANWIQNKDILIIKEMNPGLFDGTYQKMEFLLGVFLMESYTVLVEMPGIITETNSLSTKGNQVQWNVTASSILFEDYKMTVESRVVNQWMFVIAGIVLFSFILFFYVLKNGKDVDKAKRFRKVLIGLFALIAISLIIAIYQYIDNQIWEGVLEMF